MTTTEVTYDLVRRVRDALTAEARKEAEAWLVREYGRKTIASRDDCPGPALTDEGDSQRPLIAAIRDLRQVDTANLRQNDRRLWAERICYLTLRMCDPDDALAFDDDAGTDDNGSLDDAVAELENGNLSLRGPDDENHAERTPIKPDDLESDATGVLRSLYRDSAIHLGIVALAEAALDVIRLPPAAYPHPSPSPQPAKPPLGVRETAIYEILTKLPPGQGMTGEKIIAALDTRYQIIVDQGTLTATLLPTTGVLRTHYGVKNRRGGVGYYIE